MYEATIPVGDATALVSLLGTRDQHLRLIRESVAVDISIRDGLIHVAGEEAAVAQATEILEQLKAQVSRHGNVAPEQVARTISRITGNGQPASYSPAAYSPIETHAVARQVRPRTDGQAKYIESIRKHDLVFCTGPAGTGKTYLAVAMAVEALKL